MFKQHSFSGHATVNMGVIVTGLSTRLLFSDEARSQNAELNEQVSYKHVCFVINRPCTNLDKRGEQAANNMQISIDRHCGNILFISAYEASLDLTSKTMGNSMVTHVTFLRYWAHS